MVQNLSRPQAEEFVKCALSAEYFIDNYVWIQHPTRGVISFEMYDWQRSIIRGLVGGLDLVGLKSRQVGCSWIVSAFVAWLVNFSPAKTVLFLSRRERDAIKLLKKPKFILGHLREHDALEYRDASPSRWLRGEVGTDTQTSFSIIFRSDDGNEVSESTIDSLTTTGDSGRSEAASLVFLDEFAFLSAAEETWTAIRPTLTRGGQWVAVSTPNGVGGPFHRLVIQGRARTSRFALHEVHWTQCPDLDDEWFARATEGLTQAAIDQEYNLVFTQPGNPAFDATLLAAAFRPPDEFPEVASVIDASAEFYLGVDSAEGVVRKKRGSLDYHSITVLNEVGVQVFAFHALSNELTLGQWAGRRVKQTDGGLLFVPGKVSQVHARFPGVMLSESNGPGLAVANQHECPDGGEFYSIRTTDRVKARRYNQFVLALEEHQVVITDQFTYDSLLLCQRRLTGSGMTSYEASPGAWSDPVDSLLAAWEALMRHGPGREWSWGKAMGPRRMLEARDGDESGLVDDGSIMAAPGLASDPETVAWTTCRKPDLASPVSR